MTPTCLLGAYVYDIMAEVSDLSVLISVEYGKIRVAPPGLEPGSRV